MERSYTPIKVNHKYPNQSLHMPLLLPLKSTDNTQPTLKLIIS